MKKSNEEYVQPFCEFSYQVPFDESHWQIGYSSSALTVMELGSLLSKPESAIMAAMQESPAVYKESPWALEADFQCGGPTTDASASAQHPESVQWSQVWGSQSNFHHRLCFSVMVDSLPVLSMEALYPLSALLWPRRLFLNSLLRHDHRGHPWTL